MDQLMANCSACGDRFHPQLCVTCAGSGAGSVSRSRRSYCEVCHAELFHGVLPRVTDGHPGGGRGSHKHPNDEGEDSPWHENAVRAMEDPS